MTNHVAAFQQFVRSSWRFSLFLFWKLPSAWLCGVRVKHITDTQAEVIIRYRWINQNPFRSTYFACLAMAAEMSTGLLCMMYTWKQQPAVSMLVTGLKATYYKKATGVTTFTCKQGDEFARAVQQTIDTGAPFEVQALAEGTDASGNKVSDFVITWSVKRK